MTRNQATAEAIHDGRRQEVSKSFFVSYFFRLVDLKEKNLFKKKKKRGGAEFVKKIEREF